MLMDSRRQIGCILGIATYALSLSGFISETLAEYRIGPQERLRIKVHEWPALTDEVTVSEEGTISLPVIGTVSVNGSTPVHVAETLALQLKKAANLADLPQASVEISQYRPFYILGDVQKPGEYQFRPGLSVEMALALAGGAFRLPENLANRFERDLIQARGAIAGLTRRRAELRIQQARLRAELAGQSEIAPDNSVAKDIGAEQARGILASETNVLKARKQSLANQSAATQRQIAIYNEEIGFLRSRMDSAVKQQRSVEREIDSLKSLSERGLASAPRQATLDRLSAQIEGDQREIDTRIARARENIALAEGALRKVTDEASRDMNAEMRQSLAQLGEVEQQLAMNQELAAEADAMAAVDQTARRLRLNIRVTYSVSRRTTAGNTQLAVRDGDLLEPGDVLRVDQRPAYSVVTQGAVLQ